MAVQTRPSQTRSRPSRRRVLVVEDDPVTAEVVSRYLEHAGYEAMIERDGPSALARAADWRPDLLVLDIMLPQLDGLEVLRRLRAGDGSRVAVILLSAISEEKDRIRGLQLGADDYVAKPFSAAELVARVAAVLRRSAEDDDLTSPLAFDGLEIDPTARAVQIDGRSITLTQREFDLLWFMASHPGQAFTREQLMDAVWQFTFYSDTTTVTVHIRRLRAKIERNPSEPTRIQTVWGVGYRFRP
jgi:two-component system response regulator ResD